MIKMSAEGSYKIFLKRKCLPFITVFNWVGLIICVTTVTCIRCLGFWCLVSNLKFYIDLGRPGLSKG